MPANRAHAAAEPTVIAPDGIAIHTFDLPAAAFAGVAEGRIPRGRYGIHRHLSLEQFTYVIAGHVTALTGPADHPDGSATPLAPGDLLLTLPGESLQFVNDADEPARVLFICAPPYPADNADTRTLTAHHPMTDVERRAALARLDTIRAAFLHSVEDRIAALNRSFATER